jgi:hypothetical protein
MNSKPAPLHIFDRILRGVLGLALVAGIAFALTDGGSPPVIEHFELATMR